jgi:menaquinone-dependent protoporphyrinogen oxidase
MANVLIVYGTTEGHTRKVAEFIATIVRKGEHTVSLSDATRLDGELLEAGYDAVIVTAPVHQHRHHAAVTHFVKKYLPVLRARPTAFLSISLTAALPDEEHRREAQEYIAEFVHETGWQPSATLAVAGALRFARYDYFRRLARRAIGAPGDGSAGEAGDQEFTDWLEVRAFVEAFLRHVPERKHTVAVVGEPKA